MLLCYEMWLKVQILNRLAFLILAVFTIAYFEHEAEPRSLKPLRAGKNVNAGTLGCLFPLSGKYHIVGKKALRGAILATGVISSSNGHELIVFDHGYNDENLKKYYSEMVLYDKVPVVIGPIMADSVKEVNEAILKLKVPTVVFPLSETDFPGNPYLIKFSYSLEKQARVLAHYAAADLDIRTFALIYPDTRPGIIMKEVFSKAIKLFGGRMVYEIGYQDFSNDFDSQIRRLKSINPEAIFIPDSAKYSAELIMKMRREKEFDEVIFLGPSSWNSERFAKSIGKTVKGVVFTDFFYPGSTRWIHFENRFKGLFKEKPGFLEFQVYEAASIVLNAIGRYGSVRSENVMQNIIKWGSSSFYDATDNSVDGIMLSPDPLILTLKRGEIYSVDINDTIYRKTPSD